MPIDIAGSLARGRSSVQNVKLKMQESIVNAEEQRRQSWYNFEQCRVMCDRNITKHIEATEKSVMHYSRMMGHAENIARPEIGRVSKAEGWLDEAKKTYDKELGDW